PPEISGQVAGFISEWWPDSNRYGGRLQLGTLAGFASESMAGFNRNSQVVPATVHSIAYV
ncbi:hypothetical protein, partial [Phenylobacterium sp.]|uniref:hypothetical protein n=1 Tax=Phenylobacterium sp. TaxID=1871053 RepID=UPI002E335D26